MEEEDLKNILEINEDEIVAILDKGNNLILATKVDNTKLDGDKIIFRFYTIYDKNGLREDVGIVEISKYANVKILTGDAAREYLSKEHNSIYEKLKGDTI
jgi:uncharacterized protein YehS (DUF1456 family)